MNGERLTAIFEEHASVFAESRVLLPALEALVQMAHGCLASGGKILLCGNGGSAADAQHFAAELVGRFARERPALPALALTTDTSALTALANDYGYARVFARQIEALGRPGDLLIAISTSGNSENVLAAARTARERDLKVAALTGAGGGHLAAEANLLLAVPSRTIARIQEMHELLLHALAEALEGEQEDEKTGRPRITASPIGDPCAS